MMKTRFKIPSLCSLFLVISLVFSLNTQAQQKKQQGPPPLPKDQQIEKMVDDLAKALSLSEEQKDQVSEKYFEHFEEVEVKVKNSKPKREEMQTLKSEFEKDIKTILDQEQQDEFDDYMKKQRSERKAKPKK